MRISVLFRPLAALMLVLALATTAGAETWNVDPDHSAAHFSIRHLMLSQVRGMFPGMQGTVTFEDGKPTAFDVTIAVDKLNTGVVKRDQHLKSADFFEVEKYPVMRFKSTQVVPEADGFRVTGELTIKDVSKKVTLLFKGLSDPRIDPWKQTRRGGTTSFTVDRRDYNMNWNAPMDGGGVLVGNDVAVTVDIEVVKAQ